MVLKSSGPITIYPGTWLQNYETPRTKSKIAVWIGKYNHFLDNYSFPSFSATISAVKAMEM
jgi:hypothetical protein